MPTLPPLRIYSARLEHLLERDIAIDIVIVGAGAAGLMAALSARGVLDRTGLESTASSKTPSVLLLDSSPRVGLKILISGGGRCNVTNERVSEADFDTDLPHAVRGLLTAFPPESVRRFFESRGCPLYAEPMGKLFPRSDRAADVLAVLLRAVSDSGAELSASSEVAGIDREPAGVTWRVRIAGGRTVAARRLIIATGGKSLPRTGSKGFGFDLAEKLGHRLEPPMPALTPIVLSPEGPLAGLAGLTVPALLSLVPHGTPSDQIAGARFRTLARAAGSLLVTHSGISGPAPLDVSGTCARALLLGEAVELQADFWTLTRDDSPYRAFRDLPKPPGASLPADETPRPAPFEVFLEEVEALRAGSQRSLAGFLNLRMPRSLAERLLATRGLDPAQPVRQVDRPTWRRVHEAIARRDLVLTGTEGYQKAEVTSGGVLLGELHRTTLESRLHKGLHFCGEVVNATGRLGGFNFQWAWSSGYAAGAGAGAGVEGGTKAAR